MECVESAAASYPAIAPAVEPLHALHQELDIAYAAASQLDVEARLSAQAQISPDPVPGLGHSLDGREVRRCPVNQIFDHFQEAVSQPRRSRGGTRLDEHLQFPIPSAAVVILHHGLQRKYELSHASLRPEPQVDPVARPFHCAVGENRGQTVSKLGGEVTV